MCSSKFVLPPNAANFVTQFITGFEDWIGEIVKNAIDALAPHISQETLEYHYGKHHQTYVTNLNNLTADTDDANASLTDIIGKAEGLVLDDGAPVWVHGSGSAEAISLEAARHPVLENTLRAQGRAVVPMTLALGDAETVLVISGPSRDCAQRRLLPHLYSGRGP